MIILQDLINCVLGNGAVIVQGGFYSFFAYGRCHIGKRFGKRLIIVVLAVPYLFVKPTHMCLPSLLV